MISLQKTKMVGNLVVAKDMMPYAMYHAKRLDIDLERLGKNVGYRNIILDNECRVYLFYQDGVMNVTIDGGVFNPYQEKSHLRLSGGVPDAGETTITQKQYDYFFTYLVNGVRKKTKFLPFGGLNPVSLSGGNSIKHATFNSEGRLNIFQDPTKRWSDLVGVTPFGSTTSISSDKLAGWNAYVRTRSTTPTEVFDLNYNDESGLHLLTPYQAFGGLFASTFEEFFSGPGPCVPYSEPPECPQQGCATGGITEVYRSDQNYMVSASVPPNMTIGPSPTQPHVILYHDTPQEDTWIDNEGGIIYHFFPNFAGTYCYVVWTESTGATYDLTYDAMSQTRVVYNSRTLLSINEVSNFVMHYKIDSLGNTYDYTESHAGERYVTSRFLDSFIIPNELVACLVEVQYNNNTFSMTSSPPNTGVQEVWLCWYSRNTKTGVITTGYELLNTGTFSTATTPFVIRGIGGTKTVASGMLTYCDTHFAYQLLLVDTSFNYAIKAGGFEKSTGRITYAPTFNVTSIGNVINLGRKAI